LGGEALVAVGILLEIESPLTFKKILSFAAVIIGVIVGAAGTLLLLNFDEAISRSQQSKIDSQQSVIREQNSKIIILEEKLTPRSLTSEQQAEITEKVKAFSGVPYDFALQPAAEPAALMEQIAAALQAAGWNRKAFQGKGIIFNWPGQPATGVIAFAGVAIQIHESKAAEWAAAIIELSAGLTAAGVPASANMAGGATPVLPDAIHIMIGTKP
jgi:hypothetical protein